MKNILEKKLDVWNWAIVFFFQEENENLLSPWNWVRKKMSYEGEETEKWNWF